MLTSLDDIKRHLQPGFTEQQTHLLATCIYDSYEPLVTKREMNEIRSVLEDIVAVQRQTDVRLGQLTEAQQRTEVRIERLTASHEEIRDEIKDLVRVTTDLVWGQNDLRKQVGGIALSVGQGLEAYAMERIPALLEQAFGFETRSAMPEFLGPAGGTSEIDVVYRGMRRGMPLVVLCEVKTNITETEVHEFLAVVHRVRPFIAVDDVRVLFFGYRAGDDARRLIAEYGGLLAFPRGLAIS